ncbi:hypothetical protein B0H16DRAFT_299046 [Mycena metata]|uniref:Uncharacterized protein n=1 Tax=Mycena metata TaxID=1033252 RepID=A0AAD7P208_9AGAR|nr:hypothetical protein B0H16DRAFT_299046 [Mycena metata]
MPSWRSRRCMDFSGPSSSILNGSPDGQIIIRGRTEADASDPSLILESILNERRRPCDEPGEFLDPPVRPRIDPSIADMDEKYFILHKFVGDIVWMCGGAEPMSDEEDEEDDEDMVVSDIDIGRLVEKLQSPSMDFVPREQDSMFGSHMVVTSVVVCQERLPKDSVWEE